MKSDSDLIFEQYVQSKQKFVLESNFSDLYQNPQFRELQEAYSYDIECIERIIEEGRIGDALSSFAGGIGDAAGKVKEFATGKLQEIIANFLAKLIAKNPESLTHFDPSEVESEGASFLHKLDAEESSEEYSFESYTNKDFLVHNIFNESNLLELFGSTLLTEAAKKTSKKTTTKPKSKSSTKSKKTATAAISSTSKVMTKLQLQRAIDDYLEKKKDKAAALDEVLKDVQQKITGVKSPRAPQSAASMATRFKPAPKNSPAVSNFSRQLSAPKTFSQLADRGGITPYSKGELATDGGSELATTSERGLSTLPEKDVEFPDSPRFRKPVIDVEDEPKKEGLLKKIWKWVKAHPTMTSGSVVGVISAVALAMGGWPVLAPLLLSGLKGAGFAGVINSIQQKSRGGEFSWKELGKAMAKGGAIGMTGGVLAKGIGGLMGLGDQVSHSSDSMEDTTDQPYGEEPNEDNNYGEQPPKVLPVDQHDHISADHTSVTDSEFKHFNKTDFDPNSTLDQKKLEILQSLKSKYAGHIPASEYNKLVSHLHRESVNYTEGYLKFF